MTAAVAEPETPVFREGDQVKVTLRGKIRSVYEGGFLLAVGNYRFNVPANAKAQVEPDLEAPEIFGAGDYVRERDTGSAYMLLEGGYVWAGSPVFVVANLDLVPFTAAHYERINQSEFMQ